MASSHSLKTRALFAVAKYIITAIIWLIYLTCRVKFSSTNLKAEPGVIVFWHGRLAMMGFAHRRWWTKGRSCKVIISDHKDGEIITSVIGLLGVGAVRGSSSKGAARALIRALKEIDAGTDVIITPDGPRGPKHSVADGAIIIAQKKNAKLYTVNYEASRFWQFKSWDGMILPKPFSRINFSLGEPLDLEGFSLDEAKELVRQNLIRQAQQDSKFS